MPPPTPTWATSTPAMMEALPFEEYINRHQPLPTGERVFDVRDFGAAPEKYRLSTEAFAAAAWACEEGGGGTILLTGGSYWLGTVSIPSDTTRFIAADAEIVASCNMDTMTRPAGEPNAHGGSCFVGAVGHRNITITGGEWYVYEPREKPSLEPFPITALRRPGFLVLLRGRACEKHRRHAPHLQYPGDHHAA